LVTGPVPEIIRGRRRATNFQKIDHLESEMSKVQRQKAVLEPEHSIVDLLHRGSQVAEDCFARATTVAGITPRQFAVLVAVARAPNANQTDIVRMTGVDRSTMADIVRRLVKKQLLERRRTREDARAYAISLAPRAKELMQQLSADTSKAEEVLLASLSPEDRARLIGLLHKLVQNGTRQETGNSVRVPAQGQDGEPVRV
jgi:DNA-binding MarR family transcriptional regulator